MECSGRPVGIALSILLAGALLGPGCAGKRMRVFTGTMVGLNATPGDPSAGESPQVTLAYKRAELALVPTGEKRAIQDAEDPTRDADAYSALAAFHLATRWFGTTEVASFIATGHAARIVTGKGGKSTPFTESLAEGTIAAIAPDLQTRRVALIHGRAAMSDAEVTKVLGILGVAPGTNPQNALQDTIRHAETEEAVAEIESAYRIVKEGGQ